MSRNLLLFAFALLCGCHADLDWREVRSVEGAFTVWMPARHSVQSRPLSGAAAPATMQQWSARARETVFAVGYADLDRVGTNTAMETSDGLLRNISGRLQGRRPVSLGDAQGIETIALGKSAEMPLALTVRVYVRGHRLYQIAVLGKPGDLPTEELETFFDSFRIGPASG